MTIFETIILGLVEGITEYLPISSTGHLIITKELMGLSDEGSIDAFIVIIQGGAILAVLSLYWGRVKQMILGLLGRDKTGLRLAINIVVAFLPAAVLGLLLNKLIKEYLFGSTPVMIALGLGGVWMIAIDKWTKQKYASTDKTTSTNTTNKNTLNNNVEVGGIESLTPLRAFFIGVLQCVAMWPGTSRSMMTIAGGTMIGLRPKAAAEFSFLLGLPTLGGACVYTLFDNLKDAHATGEPNMFEELGVLPILIGTAVAFVASMIAVKWLVAFLNKHGLFAFGVYRIILCIAFGILVFTGFLSIS